MRTIPALLTALALAAGPAFAEPASPYDDPAVTWVAVELATAPVAPRITLVFGKPGQLGGQAPCNVYGAEQTADWPAFHTEALFSTKMACPDLGTEAGYFDALTRATQATLADDGTLVLSFDAGPLIRFRPE